MSTISRDNVRIAAKLARDGKPNDLKIRFVDGEYRAKGGVRTKSVADLYNAIKASEQSPLKVDEKSPRKVDKHKLPASGKIKSWIGDFIGDPVHTMSDASAKLSRTRKRRAARRGLVANNGCFGDNDQLTKRERRKLRLHSRRVNAV